MTRTSECINKENGLDAMPLLGRVKFIVLIYFILFYLTTSLAGRAVMRHAM